MAGYSGTPLVRKLGVKPGARLALLGAPEDFVPTLSPLPDSVELNLQLRAGPAFDVIVFFAPKRSALSKEFARLARRLSPAGGLWIAWPKKASGVATDLTEDVVRDIGLAAGLVDNKVCAVDDIWSGLRFVIRIADRKPTNQKSR